VSDRGPKPARLELDPTAYVAPGAVVVGAVRLGRLSSVWFHTVLRGDSAPIEVGDESNIQDGTVVHVDEGAPAVIGSRVTVGHRAVVHGCVIGDECLIGMGALVLSGASVGAGSMVGAGALVLQGQEIPAGSLVLGSPAKVAGPVNASHRAAIRRGSAHYVELARSYIARGLCGPHPAPQSMSGRSATDRGPMSFLEWGWLLGVMAESPPWVQERMERVDPERWKRAPRAGAWSAHEVVCHLRDTDHEVFLPRLERMLAEALPQVPNVDMEGWDQARGYREQPAREALERWAGDRVKLVSRLASLGPQDWPRVGLHSSRGPFPLGDMVRYWAEHDLSHRRQIAIALEELP